MSKKKKKKLRYSPEEAAAASAAVKKTWKKFDKRTALVMLLIFTVLCAVYYILIAMCVFWASPVLYTLTAVLFMTFFFINRGLSKDPIPPEALPDTWSDAKKREFVEDDMRRKAIGRKLMIPMVPMLLLVAIDILLVAFM